MGEWPGWVFPFIRTLLKRDGASDIGRARWVRGVEVEVWGGGL